MAEVKRALDFETHVGENTVLIHEGHPCYCPLPTEHRPHDFRYRYLSDAFGVIDGSYLCKGDPTRFAARGA